MTEAKRKWPEELRSLLELAVPVMIARSGLLLLVAVDLAMTGRAGSQELAYLGLALAPQVVLSVIGVGMMTGTSVLISQAIGAEKSGLCGAIWRTALVHGALIGVAFAGLASAAEEALLWSGQSKDLAAGAGGVLGISAWGLPAVYMSVATSMFLEAAGRPRAGVVVMLVGNILNVGLNWLLIYGNAGFPEMGAEGAVAATTIVRWCCFFMLGGYVLVRLDRAHWGLTRRPPSDSRIGRRFRRLGYPLSLTYGLESGAFAVMALFAGLVGALHVAAYQIAMNLVTLVYMLPLGVATATGIAVGHAVGREDLGRVRNVAWGGLALAAFVLIAIGIVTAIMSAHIASFYTTDAMVLAIGVHAVSLASVVFLFDGLKEVLAGALRGSGDVWPATVVNLVAFWLLMVPLGYAFGVNQQGGTIALLVAVAVSSCFATLCLFYRFLGLSKEPIAIKI